MKSAIEIIDAAKEDLCSGNDSLDSFISGIAILFKIRLHVDGTYRPMGSSVKVWWDKQDVRSR